MRAIPSARPAPTLSVRDVMTEAVLTAKPSDDVRLALQMMLWGAFHHLPVVEGNKLVGIVTERELSRVRATLDSSSRIAVREVMVPEVVTTTPEEPLADAADRMVELCVGSLPVLQGEALVGILTTSDVLASAARPRLTARPGRSTKATVGDVMKPSPRTVRRSTPLIEALALMVEHEVRHLPVVDDDGKLVGMMSDRDVRTVVGDPLEALCEANYGPAASSTVEDVMSALPVISAHADEPLGVLAWGFVDQRVGAVPVLDAEGRVIGIVSYVDVLHHSLKRE